MGEAIGSNPEETDRQLDHVLPWTDIILAQKFFKLSPKSTAATKIRAEYEEVANKCCSQRGAESVWLRTKSPLGVTSHLGRGYCPVGRAPHLERTIRHPKQEESETGAYFQKTKRWYSTSEGKNQRHFQEVAETARHQSGWNPATSFSLSSWARNKAVPTPWACNDPETPISSL